MADLAPMGRPPQVGLAEVTDDHLLQFRAWYIQARPETQSCRPIVVLSPEETVKGYRAKEKTEAEHDYAIIRLSDQRLVGRIRYFNLNPRNRSAEIGYMIGHEFQTRGYAVDALGLVLNHLFREKSLNKVYAQTAAFNLPSVALLKHWGFQQDARLRQHHELDGVMHDDLVFSLLAEEYARLPHQSPAGAKTDAPGR